MESTSRVEFGEVHLFVGPQFVITVRHAENPNLGELRRKLEADPDLLGRGSEAVLYCVLDEVVDGFAPVIAGLQIDIDEIQGQLSAGEPAVSRRIFKLLSEVLTFRRGTTPLREMPEALRLGWPHVRPFAVI